MTLLRLQVQAVNITTKAGAPSFDIWERIATLAVPEMRIGRCAGRGALLAFSLFFFLLECIVPFFIYNSSSSFPRSFSGGSPDTESSKHGEA